MDFEAETELTRDEWLAALVVVAQDAQRKGASRGVCGTHNHFR
jgi:hypothetical protein